MRPHCRSHHTDEGEMRLLPSKSEARCLPVPKRIPDAVRGVGLAAAGFVAITYVVMGSYNPFIYFNF